MILHEGHTDWVRSVAYSPDGKSVVSGSDDGTVRTWNAHGSSSIAEPLRGHSDFVYSVSYSPLGNLIASGSTDFTIRLWDTNTGQQSGDALRGDQPFASVAFSPDAKLIASGCGGLFSSSTGCAVQLWDVQTRKAVSGLFKGHGNSVLSVSFSPDSAWVVSGSYDKTIRIWDAERGTAIGGPLEGHTDNSKAKYTIACIHVTEGNQDVNVKHISGPLLQHKYYASNNSSTAPKIEVVTVFEALTSRKRVIAAV
ncbi:unnamed protein product [Rhizoctonia solani]|uniref:WD40 repeat-like protein n=1 Tax=Rhizoctonia solani TaxID=456999 RepID=A0A8H3E1H9_9AGAM|nr:unnamed protein product [Rhizoctonia solani]